MTPFPVNMFPKIEALKVPKNIPRNLPSCFFVSCFTVSFTRSIKTPEFANWFYDSNNIIHIFIQNG